MKAVVALTLATAASAAAGGTRGASASWRSRAVLSAEMQPEAVAKTLAKVEESWKAQAAEYNACNKCAGPATSFGKSCSTVLHAVVTASGGDKAVAASYMSDVCEQPVLEGWKQERCRSFGHTLTSAMTTDNYQNRAIDVANMCQGFWTTFLSEEAGAVVKVKEVTETMGLSAQASEAAKKAGEKAKEEDEETDKKIEKEVDDAEATAETEAEGAKSLLAKVPTSAPPKAAAVAATTKDVTTDASAAIRASQRARDALKKVDSKK
jgi:hypothetical protein